MKTKWATPTNLKREEKTKQPQKEREIYSPYGIWAFKWEAFDSVH